MWTIIKFYLGKSYQFLKPVLALFMARVGAALQAAAISAVAAVAQSALTGDRERKEAAFDLIKDDLRRQGITIGVDVATYAVNLAIEAAVAGLKKK